jgi:membrane-associated protease RseP (regulator of RpoE activity)
MDSITQFNPPAEEAQATRRLLDVVSSVMEIRSVEWIDRGVSALVGRPLAADMQALQARGKLVIDSERAYDTLSRTFQELGYVALLRKHGRDDVVLGLPGELPKRAGRNRLSVGLFIATLLSVLMVGAGYDGTLNVDDGIFSLGFLVSIFQGWPFALSLLGILMAHEMGHYLVARRFGVPASLPYFIPLPLSLIGTMGAVIQMKAPPRDRRALLLLGAAGPLAGMVVAVPVLILGLMTSGEPMPIPEGHGFFQEGNSILYASLKVMVFGQFLPSNGMDVFINSIALAGWAGLLVTALNLIPAGQLDGGHIAYALLGQRAKYLTWAVVGALLPLSLLWQGWLLWAALVVFLGRVHSVPLDDVTPLGPGEKRIGALAIFLFILVFVPIPLTMN